LNIDKKEGIDSPEIEAPEKESVIESKEGGTGTVTARPISNRESVTRIRRTEILSTLPIEMIEHIGIRQEGIPELRSQYLFGTSICSTEGP
jgi:hypothetical protein